MNEIAGAALAYHRRGWSIIPMRLSEKRPAVRWKRYQRRPPSASTIRRWFEGETCYGIGVVFGAVSGGLAARDFDDLAAYEQWAADNPQWAASLPTVATRRGRQVYCRATRDSVKRIRAVLGKSQGTGAIHLPDGELRLGVGCYSVLPPSQHPSGHVYGWLIPLPHGQLEAVDLCECCFLPKSLHATESTEKTEDYGDYRGEQKRTDAMKSEWLENVDENSDCSKAIELAIIESLPSSIGQRHRQVFELARALKAVPELAAAEAGDLRVHVRSWHRRALPHISTKPFEETWIDFLKAWPRVKFPKGDEPMTLLFQRAIATELPHVARQYEQEGLRLLVALCRELQRAVGGGAFYLSCRTAGKLLGVDHATASRWLYLLCAEEILSEVEKGNPRTRKASRYRYLPPLHNGESRCTITA